MAITDFWELAVAVPIRNHKFRIGTGVGTTLTSVSESGGGSLNVVNTNSLYSINSIDLIARKDDSVIVGPSSNSSYEGKSETRQIGTGTTPTYMDLQTDLTNAYAIGDSVRILGTALAGGWYVYNPNDASIEVVTPKSINPHVGEYSGGKIDDYAQHLVFDFTNATNVSDGNVWYGNFVYYFDSNPFLEGVHYRAGAVYKSYGKNVSGGCEIGLKPFDGKRQICAGGTSTIHNVDWTELTTGNSLTSFSTIDFTGAGTAYMMVFVQAKNPNDYVSMFLDDIYLEHAHKTTAITELTEEIAGGAQVYNLNVADASNFDTGATVVVIDQINNIKGVGTINSISEDYKSISLANMMKFEYLNGVTATSYTVYGEGEPYATVAIGTRVQQANEGYYQLTEYPVRSSLAVDIIDQSIQSILADSTAKIYYPMSEGDKGTRYKIRCRFENVPATMWEKLMTLYRWQKKGNLLNFHGKWDDIPPVMTGFMTISNVSKALMWDLTYRSFNFEFEECF